MTLAQKSDASFIKEHVEKSEVSIEATDLIADGAYASEETAKMATDNNIGLLTTRLLGRKPQEILGQFKLDGTDYMMTSCPAGNSHINGSYIK